MRLVWLLLWPVLFGCELAWCGLRASCLLAWALITWPFRSVYRVILGTVTWATNWYNWVVTRPAHWTAWLRGQLATTTTLETGETVSVSLMDRLDEILSLLRQTTRTYEARQEGSEFIACKEWPKGLVVVRDSAAMAKGMGFLTVLNGKHCLVTAAHVAMKCKRGIILSAGVDPKHVNIPGDPDMMVQSTADVVYIEVPPNTAGLLGVAKAKKDVSPATGLAVTLYGYVNGKFVSSLGVMGDPTRYFGFKHGASTVRGFSGTPIFYDGKIVGIHSRSNGLGVNFGLSLDLVTGTFERNDYNGKRHMREQDEDYEYDAEREARRLRPDTPDLDMEEVAWRIEEREIRTVSDENSWQQRISDGPERFINKKLSGINWQDESPMDEDDLPTWENVNEMKFESVPVFRDGPKLGANNITNGKAKEGTPELPTVTTSPSQATSTSSIQEAKETPDAPPKKKKKRSKRSKVGNGPKEVSKPSETASESIQGNCAVENGPPAAIAKIGSKPKSWTQAYTQKLKFLLGTGLGFDEAEVEAKRLATEMFPRSPAPTSTELGTSSKQTL